MNKIPPVSKIKPGVYLINEFDGTNCYLVTGSEKVLLADCGTGFCDILSAVKSVTSLPVILVATHGHVDHIGGAGQFEEMYIHRADTGILNHFQMTRFMRKVFTQGNAAVRKHGFSAGDVKKGGYKTKWIPVDDGFVFDLGGKTIAVHSTPGHSKGSIALVDEQDKIIFSGDNVCDALWLHLPGRTSVEEWLPSAKWLLEKSADYSIYWGHRTPLLTSEYIAQVVQWGEEILSSYKKNTLLPKTRRYPDREDGIIFKTNTVFRKG